MYGCFVGMSVCLSVCAAQQPGAHGGQKVFGNLELELQMVASYRMGAGN